MKKQTEDLIIVTVMMVFCIWMGVLIGQEAPEYKAHVKGDDITVVPIN